MGRKEKVKIQSVAKAAAPTVQPLPIKEAITPEIYKGPTQFSNWVIPKKLLVGSFPRAKMVMNILDVGVDTFVNLVQEREIQRYGPYHEFAQSKAKKGQKITYIHFPIYGKIISCLKNG